MSTPSFLASHRSSCLVLLLAVPVLANAQQPADAGEAAGYPAWIADILCPAGEREVDLSGPAAQPRLGVEVTATRNMTAEAAGLSRSDMENLEVAWAIGFPTTMQLRAAPAIAGSTIFYPVNQTNYMLALDARTGCVRWAYESETALRSSAALHELEASGRTVLFMGDGQAQVHAVDARTGEALWVADGRADPGVGSITGSVVPYGDKVIVPISASGVSQAANPNFECCTGRGAVTVLDAETGERVWEYFTMPEAEYTGEVNSAGARLRGPSGAPIWSTPSVDAERGRVYVTTGQNTSLPATETSDAVIALDLETGEEIWVFQGTPDDVWNMACLQNGPNCPDPEHSILEDWDFGGSAILVEGGDGRELLLAGQKSGHLWALDPDDGELVWSRRVGEGGTLGGNHWGIAVDGERVFLSINDPYSGSGDGAMPGMYAFDIATGAPAWEHRLASDCSGDRRQRMPTCETRYGISATPLVVDGAVVSGALDGRVHIFDGEDGTVLFRYDTARPFDTINGVDAFGGSIDSHAVAAGAGTVVIGSGYQFLGGRPGNVLLGFRPGGE